MRDWWKSFRLRHHLFIERLGVYFIWLLGVTILCIPLFLFHGLFIFDTHPDSARDILSALVQSEAAIVAIVISLTLVAVELTASAYSPRVVETFIKDPDMRILLFLYGTSIFYDLLVLRLLKGGDGPIDTSIEWLISIALWLGAFTFVALYPYIKNTIHLLKPAKIIERLSEEITTKKMLTYIKLKEECLFSWDNVPGTDNERLLRFLCDDLDIGRAGNAEISRSDEGEIILISKNKILAKITIDEKKEKATLKIHGGRTHDLKVKKEEDKRDIYKEETDPVQPIVDIIHKSVNNYDLETVRKGLEEIVKHAKKVISRENQEKTSKYFCDPLKRIGRLAASKDDEGSTIEVIKKLESFGTHTATAELNAATEQVAVTLGAVGENSAGKGKAFEEAVKEVASSLKAVGIAAVEKELGGATEQVVSSLEAVGKAAAKKMLGETTEQVAKTLGALGNKAATAGGKLTNAVLQAVFSLEAVGTTAAEKGKELERATNHAALCIEVVVITAAEKMKELENVTGQKELENVTRQAATSLGSVGKAAAEAELEKATEDAATYLGAVVKTAMANNLEGAIKEGIKSLLAVGTTILEKKGSENAIDKVVTYLNNLKTSNVNLFETIIPAYELKLKKPEECNTFQKFKNRWQD